MLKDSSHLPTILLATLICVAYITGQIATWPLVWGRYEYRWISKCICMHFPWNIPLCPSRHGQILKGTPFKDIAVSQSSGECLWNIDQETGYPEWGSFVVFLSPSRHAEIRATTVFFLLPPNSLKSFGRSFEIQFNIILLHDWAVS
jgi:hypothetical protein